MEDIWGKMAKGAAWMVAFKLCERMIGVVSTFVLARLLIPADFGLVAIGTSIFSVLEIMSTFSFDLALIQNQHAVRRHYDTAWTFNVIFGAVNGVAMVVRAHPAAIFFNEARVEWIMYALGGCSLLSGFDNIGIVAFQKEMQLHKEFRLGIAKKLVAFAVTVWCAFTFRNYWALVAGIVAGRLTSNVLSYWMHPYRPRLSLAGARDLFHFSKWLLINNLLVFVNNRGIDLVIGKLAGPRALGLYSVSYEISNLPTTELVFPVSRAVFPGLSRLASDRPALRNAFLDVIALIAMVALPAGIGVCVVAQPMVAVVLGAHWRDAVPLIQVLAIFGVLRALHGPTGSVYLAVGRPRLISMLQALQIGIAAPLLVVFTIRFGITGAPWAILTAMAVAMPTNYVCVIRVLQLSVRQLAQAFWRPLASALCMFGVCSLVRGRLGAAGVHDGVPALLIIVTTGVAVYVAAVIALWRLARCPDGAENRLFSFLKTRFRPEVT
jgi:O-antigen/teichoic acid export membrane protein